MFARLHKDIKYTLKMTTLFIYSVFYFISTQKTSLTSNKYNVEYEYTR